jgi:ligand-binding sensor domain-containing protein
MYGQAEGLTNLAPLTLLQDHTGFLWAGTQNGLFRYDGSHFDSFGVAQGLPSTQIVSLYEDTDGTLMVATTGGVAFSTHGHFAPLLFEGAPLTTTRRQGLVVDADETVYLATDNGLAVQVHTGIPGSHLLTAGPEVRIYSVYRDPAGKIWAGCGERLCTVENRRLMPVAAGLPPTNWRGFRSDRQGNLWMVSEQSIWVRRAATGRYEQLPPVPFSQAGKFTPLLGDPVLEVA